MNDKHVQAENMIRQAINSEKELFNVKTEVKVKFLEMGGKIVSQFQDEIIIEFPKDTSAKDIIKALQERITCPICDTLKEPKD